MSDLVKRLHYIADGNVDIRDAITAIESLQALLNEYKDAECRAVKLHGEAEARVKELDDLLERADYVRHQQIQFINLLQKEIKALKEGVAFSPVCPPLSNEKSS